MYHMAIVELSFVLFGMSKGVNIRTQGLTDRHTAQNVTHIQIDTHNRYGCMSAKQ